MGIDDYDYKQYFGTITTNSIDYLVSDKDISSLSFPNKTEKEKNMNYLYRLKLVILDLDERVENNLVYETVDDWSRTNKLEDLIFNNAEAIKKALSDHNAIRMAGGFDPVNMNDLQKEVIVGKSWQLKPAPKTE